MSTYRTASPHPLIDRSASGLAALLLLAACSATPDAPLPEPQHPKPPSSAAVTQDKARIPMPQAARPRPTNARKAAPIPDQPLNIVTTCAFRDETGYSGQLNLAVDQAVVSRFAATVNVPKRGKCRFDLKQFAQTRQMPTVELRHHRDECTVRLWEQEHRVTVAFDGCRRQCEGNARDYLWPILADRRDNSCA